MESEHKWRARHRAWKTEIFRLNRKICNIRETADFLNAQIRLLNNDLRTKSKIVQTMRAVLNSHQISCIPNMVSLRLCESTDDQEICPLSQQVHGIQHYIIPKRLILVYRPLISASLHSRAAASS